MKCAKPHEWNSGAAMWVVCSACSGIFERKETAGSSDSALPREAPLGVPVVPEVRITARPSRSEGTGSAGSPSAISSSSVGSSVSSESVQATKRLRRLPASSISSANSSS